MESEQAPNRLPRVLSAQLLIGGVLLALGLETMLSTFDFEAIYVPSLLVLLGLVVMVIWVAQLLISWEITFRDVDVEQLLLGGMLDLWTSVLYIGLVYLACRYQPKYSFVLLFITLIAIFDLLTAAIHMKHTGDKRISDVNRNWVKRDIRVFTPLLGIAWLLYFVIDRNSLQPSPTLVSGIVFLAGMIIAYLSDMWINPEFYGTHKFRQAVSKVWAGIQLRFNPNRR